MSGEYAPTVEYVREFYAKFQANLRMHSDYDDEASELAEAEFDRVMAAHDVEVAAKAWDECLDEIEKNELNTAQAREGNPYRMVVAPTTPEGEQDA